MSFESINEIIETVKKENKEFWQVILEDDMNESRITLDEEISKMMSLYNQMKKTVKNYDGNLKSNSKLSGGDGEKIKKAIENNNIICGGFIGKVMERAIKTAESNSCMKRIVAAPTAGSCGVIPAVLITYQEKEEVSDEQIVKALFVSAGIGDVISLRASISGAEGGCQAEIGSASAMAAGALAYLRGGDAECVAHASALALKSLLGLVCDPVAGLVEVPCIKRNVIGAVNAITSADMALAGIRSRISPDEVIDAMRNIGNELPSSLKETSKGGLAATITGIKIANEINRK